jgi:uncharacterized protein YgiM (DUF1202 family)
MPNRGLDNRLRQHSRRAGLIIGLSMMLTIALCVGGFAVIYAKIDPFTRDFVTAATLTPTKTATKESKSGQSASTNSGGSAQPTETPVSDTPTETPAPVETTPTATATPGFTPDYVLSSDVRVNLRSGPSQDTDIVNTLDSGTELQYLNESQDDDNGTTWMKFETADGEEGWIRQIDVSKTG